MAGRTDKKGFSTQSRKVPARPAATKRIKPRMTDRTDKESISTQRRKDTKTETTLCSAIPKNCAFLAKFFLLFVSFVCFCKILLVAALPRQAFAPLRLCVKSPRALRVFAAKERKDKSFCCFFWFFAVFSGVINLGL
jgi:hypothetical protein